MKSFKKTCAIFTALIVLSIPFAAQADREDPIAGGGDSINAALSDNGGSEYLGFGDCWAAFVCLQLDTINPRCMQSINTCAEQLGYHVTVAPPNPF